MKCSNCEANKPPALYVMRSGNNPETVVRICDDCVQSVLTMKIVLKRKDAKGEFAFEGYLPIEMAK